MFCHCLLPSSAAEPERCDKSERARKKEYRPRCWCVGTHMGLGCIINVYSNGLFIGGAVAALLCWCCCFNRLLLWKIYSANTLIFDDVVVLLWWMHDATAYCTRTLHTIYTDNSEVNFNSHTFTHKHTRNNILSLLLMIRNLFPLLRFNNWFFSRCIFSRGSCRRAHRLSLSIIYISVSIFTLVGCANIMRCLYLLPIVFVFGVRCSP